MPIFKRVWNGLDQIHTISQIIIKAGSLFAALFLVVGMLTYHQIVQNSPTFYTEFLMATQIIKTAVMIFTEVLIAAVIFDYISLKRG